MGEGGIVKHVIFRPPPPPVLGSKCTPKLALQIYQYTTPFHASCAVRSSL